MEKNFDDLTIVDDYMFCTVMEDPHTVQGTVVNAA